MRVKKIFISPKEEIAESNLELFSITPVSKNKRYSKTYGKYDYGYSNYNFSMIF